MFSRGNIGRVVGQDHDPPFRELAELFQNRTDDVTVDVLLAEHCDESHLRSAIQFFPSGMSCGGVIALARLGIGYEIRVNWLTGGIEIVSFRRS